MIIGYSRAAAALPSVVPPSLSWQWPLSIAPDLPVKRLMPNLGWVAQVGRGDPSVLLMGFEGADGSTGAPGMTDESPFKQGNAFLFGSAQIDTAQFKFGSSSLLIGAVGDGIWFPADADYNISATNADPYTIETWFRYSTVVGVKALITHRGLTDGTYHFALQNDNASPSELVFVWSATGFFADAQTVTTSGAGITTGQWYHIAVDKDAAGKIRIYVDGVMLGSATPANSVIFQAGTNVITIGTNTAGSASQLGWHDEVRISKGVARYASDGGFTPPTAAFPRF